MDKNKSKSPMLDAGQIFEYNPEICSMRLLVEWLTKAQGNICDLDLMIYFYDERARFIERLDSSSKFSQDGSTMLLSDLDAMTSSTSYFECAKLNLTLVDPSTCAILFFLDGGSRNFQYVQNIIIRNIQSNESQTALFVPADSNDAANNELFTVVTTAKRDYQAMALFVLYKTGWNSETNTALWSCKPLLEPLYVTNVKDKDEKCTNAVINNVPALYKFRPRLFDSVRTICSALSSLALPHLKQSFQAREEGLQLGQFTEVIFKQLYLSQPKIIHENEAPYTVAMIHEMFSQIDYNGDNNCDWDEFTTFCIHMSFTASNKPTTNALDEYTIEYMENIALRDNVLSPHRLVTLMRHFPEINRVFVAVEDGESLYAFDEKFEVKSMINPVVITTKAHSNEKGPAIADRDKKVIINDIIYLHGRDLLCVCSSDHCITAFKEASSSSSAGGKTNSYMLHNKIYHHYIHIKLAWSKKNNLLCSVASDQGIYGWDIDIFTNPVPIFQISRHSDIITDIINLDSSDLFISCGMDKRIVLWSSTSRRVKGILLGHKRGVRMVSAYESTLVSIGFEFEAKTWDVNTKDNVAILKGHRYPTVATKLMCERARDEREYRALTVDESGEFRLWNIYVKERIGDPRVLSAIQIFQMHNPEIPINRIKFIGFPNDPKNSTEYYSDIIACSTKLLKFLPEKQTKDFAVPLSVIYNDPATTIVGSIGRNLYKYDASTGNFINVYADVYTSDITAMCQDGERGRRLFLGTANGNVLLLNFILGEVVDEVEVHSKEITCISSHVGSRNCIYTGSLDGKIKMLEEANGQIHVHNSIDVAFGEGIGVSRIRIVYPLRVIVAASSNYYWGIWSDVTFKKVICIKESVHISNLEVICASGDAEDIERSNENNIETGLKVKQSLITLAVALTTGIINVYTFDVVDIRGIMSHQLVTSKAIYITDFALLRTLNQNCINYSNAKGSATIVGSRLIATTDDGKSVTWDANNIRTESEKLFKETYKDTILKSCRLDSDASVLIPPLNKASNVIKILASYTWLCHHDGICFLTPMHEHGCFLTCSFDGFFRVWNIDKDCLGELPLPNITEKMKNPSFRIAKSKDWKFILEKLTITKYHCDLAKNIVNNILASQHQHQRHHDAERRKAKAMGKDVGKDIAGLIVETSENKEKVVKDKASQLREWILKDLLEGGDDEESNDGDNLLKPSTANSNKSSERGNSRGAAKWTSIDKIATSKTYQVAPAFSDESISTSHYNKLIDDEGCHILMSLTGKTSQTETYERTVPQILLRNPSLSTGVKMPSLNSVNRTEAKFGQQKNMYKSANSFLMEKDNVPKKFLRHAITLAKIEHHVKDLGSMVKIIDPIVRNEEVSIDGSSKVKQNRHLHHHDNTVRFSNEQIKPLDKVLLNKLVQKVDDIYHDHTLDQSKYEVYTKHSTLKRNKNKTFTASNIELIESKLKQAISDCYNEQRAEKIIKSDVVGNMAKLNLTTRALLPYYKLEDIKHFMEIFQKVDEDFSGDLDIDEWVNLFASLNQNISAHEARLIFLKLDKDQDGFITVKELLPAVFSKATKEQMKLIKLFVESEIQRSAEGVTKLFPYEVDQLFELYDVDKIKFVAVGYIRERIRSMNLTDRAQYLFMEQIFEIDDEEMVNQIEFVRLFKTYTHKDNEQN